MLFLLHIFSRPLLQAGEWRGKGRSGYGSCEQVFSETAINKKRTKFFDSSGESSGKKALPL
jgi:hypothetical protein